MEELTEIENFLLDGKIPIKKYKSKRTGITIVQADVQGPTVNGYFCLATEAQDDDGLPHTLEHLIFLGSHDYPYKGVLDGLANRCLAMGTNAWTDIDHTCYTISCAGYEGFLNILPVYLDHILWATITDEGFYTEVHHITSKGKDAGVVYCEMEGRENTGPSRIQRKLLQLLYPGDSGYNKETGGICQNLRSLTVDKVRQYHKDFYRTDNLCLIITGKVPVEEIAARLKTVEDNVIQRAGQQQQPIPRPWHIHDVPALDKTVEKEEVLFPADDEETGYVVVGWRGPVITELSIGTALEVLWEYLTDSAVSPLQKEFVDIPEPLCSSIHAGHNLLSIRSVYVTLTGVPTPHLEEIPEQLFAKLHHIVGVDGQEREGIDMERMKAVIDHLRQQYKTALEDDPHETIAHSAIHDFLYNPRKDGDELKHVVDEIERLNEMATKGEDFWLDMISKFLLDAPHVTIIGRPSECLGKQMADDEQNRVEKQKQDLGEEKLAELEVKLKDAIEKNEVPVPPEIIQQFVVPDVNKIPLIPVATVRNGEAVGEGATLEASQKLKALLNVESSDLPFCTQFDNIQSEFIEIIAYINTSQMSAEDRVLLEWWLDVVFEGPISRINADGSQELIPHDQVIAELNSSIVSHSSALGFGGANFVCGAFAQLASISLKCELSKYKETVVRLREFLWQTKFERERLLISAKKLDIDATSYRRSGSKVAAAVNKEQNFSTESNHYITNFIRQQQFLRKQLQLLANDEGAAQIEAQVEAFRRELLKPERIFVQVLGNLEKVEDPAGPWRWGNFLPPQPRPDVFSLFNQESHVSHEAGKVVLSKELQSERATGGQNHIVGLAAVESCVLLQSCQWNSSFDAVKKTAGMTVLIEYLTTMESIFWKQIRGQGLSYGYSIANNNETGLLLFSLTRSNSVVKAYQEAKRIIEDFRSKKHQFDETFVESAKSSVLFSIISREQTPRTAAMQTYVAFLKGVDNRATLAAIGSIQLPDLTEALEDLARLFDSEATNTTITCNVSAVSDIVQSFESDFGKTFTTVTQLEEFFCPGTVVLMEDDGENEDENMYSDDEE